MTVTRYKHNESGITVDAYKWDGNPLPYDDPIWAVEAINDGRITFIKSKPFGFFVEMVIHTLDGDECLSKGDYIVMSSNGIMYAMKEHDFEKMYHMIMYGKKKPPIGLMQRDLYEELAMSGRKQDIRDAIERYHKAGKKIPKEWHSEYNDLVSKGI